MTLLVGAVGLLGLWWAFGKARASYPALTTRVLRQVAGYVGLALAGLFLVRGRMEFALVLLAASLWLLEGTTAIRQRARDAIARADPRRMGRPLVRFDSSGDGVVLFGPHAGQPLGTLPVQALRSLLRASYRDPETAHRLEAYLDRRHAGWREHADADAHPRARRAANPGAMTQQEAYEILGLQGGASLEEIRTAHRTLMKRFHPDQGGTAEQAARVNAARDRLTNRHR